MICSACNITVEPVHPRACGEQYAQFTQEFPPSGSSPRLRGISGAIASPSRRIGSSPRLRGTVDKFVEQGIILRFIPAPAGNRGPTNRSRSRRPVHPRACGEQLHVEPAVRVTLGSSPRLRGTGWRAPNTIPATVAGSSPRLRGTGLLKEQLIELYAMDGSSPRLRGTVRQGSGSTRAPRSDGSSPRLRGTEQQHRKHRHGPRFIPAPAGNSTWTVIF